MKWFRFYYEVAEDPKVQTLPSRLFKLWVNVLCLAAKNKGIVPPVSQIAYALRIGRARVDLDMMCLRRVGLFDETEDGLIPHNWNGRQFKSDDVAERVRKQRGNAEGNVTKPLRVTPVLRTQNTENRGEGEETSISSSSLSYSSSPPPPLPGERR